VPGRETRRRISKRRQWSGSGCMGDEMQLQKLRYSRCLLSTVDDGSECYLLTQPIARLTFAAARCIHICTANCRRCARTSSLQPQICGCSPRRFAGVHAVRAWHGNGGSNGWAAVEKRVTAPAASLIEWMDGLFLGRCHSCSRLDIA
jgi:hypothetical protein